jgi:hypothetical protein
MHALAQSAPADLAALCETLALPAERARLRPERVLERLVDLSRAVALGAVLDFHERGAPPAPGAEARQAELARLGLFEERLVRRLGELRAQLDRQFANANRGARPLPDAAGLWMLVSEHLAESPQPSKKIRTAFAARLAARYAALPSGALAVTFKELGWLHQELREALLQGSAHSRRLAALDETLDAAVRAELEQCRTRLERGLGQGLEQGLHSALDALQQSGLAELQQAPSALAALKPGALQVESWFTRTGCVGEFLFASRRLVHALLDLEWDALMGLLQAALEPLRAAPRDEQPVREEPER